MAEEKQKAFSTVETAPAKKTSTQSYLDIDHIRDGVAVLKDGSMRMVLLASAVNFELKSEMERNSIIYAYQNFINSIESPIQIVVQSRKLDLDNYLDALREKEKSEDNELLKVQINDYVAFVDKLISVANIMDKRFYVVVPHYPGGFKKVGAFGKIFSSSQGNISVTNFEEEKKYLKRKTENVASGLRGVGVRAVQLNTQELIELYYGVYNPDISTSQKLVDISQLESEVIEKAPEEMEIG